MLVGTQVVLFGGSDRAPVTYDDLWVLETGKGVSARLEKLSLAPYATPSCRTRQPRLPSNALLASLQAMAWKAWSGRG